MDPKQNLTFIIVSSASGETKKVVLPLHWVRVSLIILVFTVLALFAGLLDYFSLIAQSLENKRLRVENTQLKTQFQAVEAKVFTLESSLERVKSFTTKLKLITNVDAGDRATRLSMNANPAPGTPVNEYEPMEERASSKELMAHDDQFATNKPVDEFRGELAAQNAPEFGTLIVRIDRAVKETNLREQSVIELWEVLSERQSILNATPNIKPARGYITSRFGYRMAPFTGKLSLHAGLDIAATPGSPIYSPADGIVTYAGWDESYGRLVSIDHGYGISTRFGHNSQVYVQVGQKVSKWDVIAAVGNTGRSTGPHLHYEVRLNGTPVDPSNFILDESF